MPRQNWVHLKVLKECCLGNFNSFFLVAMHLSEFNSFCTLVDHFTSKNTFIIAHVSLDISLHSLVNFLNLIESYTMTLELR